MNKVLKILSPYLLILLGLFVLFFIDQAEAAGVCILLGIVMTILRIWPEEWETDKANNNSKIIQ